LKKSSGSCTTSRLAPYFKSFMHFDTFELCGPPAGRSRFWCITRHAAVGKHEWRIS
jgi:hypothetical protein